MKRKYVDRNSGPRPGQKTFRAPVELLDRLDARAMVETAALGVDVGASDIIRRGLEWALAQPLPGPRRRRCNVVRGFGLHSKCLACLAEGGAAGVACPDDGEQVPA